MIWRASLKKRINDVTFIGRCRTHPTSGVSSIKLSFCLEHTCHWASLVSGHQETWISPKKSVYIITAVRCELHWEQLARWKNETRKNPLLLLKWFCSRRLKREGGKSEESGKRKQAKSGRKSSARIRGGASAPPHQSGRVPKKPRCSRRHAGTFRCGEGHHRKCCRKKSNNNNGPGHIIRLASVYTTTTTYDGDVVEMRFRNPPCYNTATVQRGPPPH